MFDKLLDFLFKATDVTPRYTAEHCLVVSRAMGGCNDCANVCPHQAITIGRQVEIDPVDCTGCGLCLQVCPSEALEARVSYQPGAPLKCSQVAGNAQTVQCLTRLSITDLVRLGSARDRVTLVRNDCATCKVGSAGVPDVLELMLTEAQSLAALRGRALESQVLIEEKYDTTDNPNAMSRRDLLRGGFKSVQRGAADVLAPLDPGEEEGAAKALPVEQRKRYHLLELSELSPETPVPWPLPRVTSGCIMCPVCTNVCPTDAFKRDFDPPSEGGGSRLLLDPERCNGCEACVNSCPVKVITLEDSPLWSEVSGGTLEAFRKTGDTGVSGMVARSK